MNRISISGFLSWSQGKVMILEHPESMKMETITRSEAPDLAPDKKRVWWADPARPGSGPGRAHFDGFAMKSVGQP